MRGVDGLDEGETGWALLCHSLGLRKVGINRYFLKKGDKRRGKGQRKVKGWVHPDYIAWWKEPGSNLSSQAATGS